MRILKSVTAVLGCCAVLLMTAQSLCADDNKVVMDGSTTVGPIAKAFAGYYMAKHPDVSVTVNESGSGAGAKSLINSDCAIANMSRPMKTKAVSYTHLTLPTN